MYQYTFNGVGAILNVASIPDFANLNTQRGGAITMSTVTSGGSSTISTVPFHCNVVLNGLVIGTAIWIDVGLATNGAGGTASINNISISAVEI